MRHLRTSAAALAVAFAIVGCSDDSKPPTSPGVQAPEASSPDVRRGGLTAPIIGVNGSGTLQITQFAVNNRELVAHGVFNGTVDGKTIKNQQVRNIPVTPSPATTSLSGGMPAVQQVAYVASLVQQEQVCPILHLEVGPIFLDLLGLQLETNEIVIDLRAVGGPGALLGNLLCAVVGLLDDTPLNVGLINQLLAQINALLSQILS